MNVKLSFVSSLVAAVALGGCGELGQLSGRTEQPQLVTKQELAKYPPNSPAHTTLAWWRGLQYGSPALAAGYYSDRLNVTSASLARQLQVGPNLLELKSGLRVVDVIRRGDRATVLAIRTRSAQYPNGRTDTVRAPQTVNLRREAGVWKLADNNYIEKTFRDVRRFVQTGSKQTEKHTSKGQRAP